MHARGALVAVLLVAVGASGCLASDDDFDDASGDDSDGGFDYVGPSSRTIEIFDDRIVAGGNSYNASGPRDEGPANASHMWTMHVMNRGDREHAVTIVDTDNNTLAYDHVLQPSQQVQFSFPYRGNFTLYDRLTSTPDSGLFVDFRIDFSLSRTIEIFDDRIVARGSTYNASGPRDSRPAFADPMWTMHVVNRGDREHAVTIVDRDNDTRQVYDHVLQPSQDVQFSFPYRGNFTLYDRLTSTPDSGLYVDFRVDFTTTPA